MATSSFITHITGIQLKKRWNMDAVAFLQKLGRWSKQGSELSMIEAPFDTKVKLANLILRVNSQSMDLPPDLDARLDSLLSRTKFELGKVEEYEQKHPEFFKHRTSSQAEGTQVFPEVSSEILESDEKTPPEQFIEMVAREISFVNEIRKAGGPYHSIGTKSLEEIQVEYVRCQLDESTIPLKYIKNEFFENL